MDSPFLALHQPGNPLLMPNAWDAGSAKVLASLGYQAIATTSSGFAATLGRLDGSVTRDEALAHGAALSAAVAIPVSADLENCFADDPDGVATTIALARESGLAGGSVEDYDGAAIYDFDLAVARVQAAAEAAHAGPQPFVLTARAENHIRGRDDLDDTIRRLQAFVAAGADVVFAPGVARPEDIRRVVDESGAPVSQLALANGPTVPELGELGVARISVGGCFAYAAIAGLVAAGRELLEQGTLGYWEQTGIGGKAARAAFTET